MHPRRLVEVISCSTRIRLRGRRRQRLRALDEQQKRECILGWRGAAVRTRVADGWDRTIVKNCVVCAGGGGLLRGRRVSRGSPGVSTCVSHILFL
jgi:hypothetical protein